MTSTAPSRRRAASPEQYPPFPEATGPLNRLSTKIFSDRDEVMFGALSTSNLGRVSESSFIVCHEAQPRFGQVDNRPPIEWRRCPPAGGSSRRDRSPGGFRLWSKKMEMDGDDPSAGIHDVHTRR